MARACVVLFLALPATGQCANTRRSSACKCASEAQARFDGAISAAVGEVASVWPIPPSFIKAVIHAESAFQPAALSSAGAIGLMQVLPSNAWRLGLTAQALWNPTDNILAGTRLLAVLLRHYHGDVISALVGYNTRPRRALAPIPANGETPAYVRSVLRFWTSLERCTALRPNVYSGKAALRPD